MKTSRAEESSGFLLTSDSSLLTPVVHLRNQAFVVVPTAATACAGAVLWALLGRHTGSYASCFVATVPLLYAGRMWLFARDRLTEFFDVVHQALAFRKALPDDLNGRS
jgi:hypothetical protein